MNLGKDSSPRGLADEPSYAVVIPSKNGEKTIEQTLQSLLTQSVRPQAIIVVDDASNDRTPQILRKYPEVSMIRLDHNYPRDFARVPHLINLGLAKVPSSCEYAMISGDDSLYPSDYAEKLIRRFRQNHRLKIASGNIRSREKAKVVAKTPQGSGRMFTMSFLKRNLPFPISIGWESGILFKALQQGGEIKCFDDITFEHTKAYSDYSVRTFGHAMYVLGYPPLFVFARLFKSFIVGEVYSRRQVFHEFLGYIEYALAGHEQLDVKDFVTQTQYQRLREFLWKLL